MGDIEGDQVRVMELITASYRTALGVVSVAGLLMVTVVPLMAVMYVPGATLPAAV